jgi:hypothetical protein
MNPSTMAKCACQNCGLNLEFPIEGVGMVINCPDCQKETRLVLPEPDPALTAEESPEPVIDETQSGPFTINEIVAAFSGPVKPKFASFLYQIGLLIVALAMVVLPILYLAMIGAASLAVIWWAKHGLFLLSGGGGIYVTLFKSGKWHWLFYAAADGI